MAHSTRAQGLGSFELTVANRSSPSTHKATSSPFPLVVQLSSAKATIAEVKRAVQEKKKQLSPERQRLTTEDKRPLTDDARSLADEGIKAGDTLYVKDLGPQVAWRTVFLTEYFGPLFIHPLIYYAAPSLWPRSFTHSRLQTLALCLVMFHYVKREVETVFVHRFSNATMPVFNIFKNSAHYWGLSGVLLGGAIYSPWHGAEAVKGTIQDNEAFLAVCATAFMLSQCGTAWAHVVLRNLRRPGSKERNIPRGGFFELVSCPNYFFEICAWTSFTVLTFSPAAAIFAAVSAAQMAAWAVKKHRNYRKEFKNYPRGRKAMIPFAF